MFLLVLDPCSKGTDSIHFAVFCHLFENIILFNNINSWAKTWGEGLNTSSVGCWQRLHCWLEPSCRSCTSFGILYAQVWPCPEALVGCTATGQDQWGCRACSYPSRFCKSWSYVLQGASAWCYLTSSDCSAPLRDQLFLLVSQTSGIQINLPLDLIWF